MSRRNEAPEHALTPPIELCREGLAVQSCRSVEETYWPAGVGIACLVGAVTRSPRR